MAACWTLWGGCIMYLIPLWLQVLFGVVSLGVLMRGIRMIRRELRDGAHDARGH